MKAGLKHRVNYILKRYFLIPPKNLKKTKYLDDLGLSKVEQKEMLNYLEVEFHILVSEQDERKIKTIHDTILLLDQYLAFNQKQLTVS
jgi:hypothetical protein